MSLCEEKLCKNEIYDKKTHIRKMLEIKKKIPGNFEENEEYKHLAQCLTNINGYQSKAECDLDSGVIDMDFIIKNLYSSDAGLRKRAENMFKKYQEQEPKSNKSDSKSKSDKNELTSEEKKIIQNINPKLHRPKRKMRQNAVITYIFYNYVSSNSLNVLL